MLESGCKGEFYNISSGEFQTNLDVTRKILSYFGLGDERIEFVNDRLGHDFRYALDSSKIKKELSWKCLTPFDQGLQLTIEWYSNNPEFLQKAK